MVARRARRDCGGRLVVKSVHSAAPGGEPQAGISLELGKENLERFADSDWKSTTLSRRDGNCFFLGNRWARPNECRPICCRGWCGNTVGRGPVADFPGV